MTIFQRKRSKKEFHYQVQPYSDAPELFVEVNQEPHSGDIELICRPWFADYPECAAINISWPGGSCRITEED